MSIRDFLTKLQNLPEKQKKIILWMIIVVLALAMGFFWLKTTAYRLSKFGEDVKKVDLPPLEMQNIYLPELPADNGSATLENNAEE